MRELRRDRRRAHADETHALIKQGKYEEAITLFDELVEFADLPLQAYCNALWVVQRDNTKLPIDATRSRKYLSTCLPHGGANPPIYLNAAAVCVEIEELDDAITNLVLAKRGGVDLAPYLDEPLFAPLRTHARWNEVLEGAPELRAPSQLQIAEAAVERGDLADAMPALLLDWRATRSTRVADLLDRAEIACGRRVGYSAAWIEQGLAEGSLALMDQLHGCGAVLRDGKGGYGEKEGIWLVDDCDDPRFATGLLRVMAAGPVMAERKKVEEVWSKMLSTLVALGDLRVIEPLAMVGPAVFAQDWPMMRRLRAELATTLAELRGQRAAVNDSADEDVLARLEAALSPIAVPPLEIRGVRQSDRGEVPALPSHQVLDMALTRIEGGALEEAQAMLITAWRRVRSPRIANLVDALEARIGRAPLVEEWSEDANVDAERLWTLRGMDDPRVSTLLCRMFDDPPHIAAREHANGVEAMWVAVLDALRDLRDRRAIDPMVAFAKRAPGMCASIDREARMNMYEQTPLGGFLQYQMTKVVDDLRKEKPVLSEAEDAACDTLERALEAELRARSAAEEATRQRYAERRSLLRAIGNAVDEDAPRLAYAEWLRTTGDGDGLDELHAALIDEQITGDGTADGTAAPSELLEAHVLGELAPFVRVTRWERGFPVAAELDAEYGVGSAEGHLAWSTIEELEVHSWSRYERELCKIALHPVMRAVRSLSGVSASGLVTLTRAREQPFVHVALDVQNERSHRWSGSLREAFDRMPALRSLELLVYPHDLKLELATLLAWPIIARLDHLGFAIRVQPYSFPTGWIDARAQIEASALRELQLRWEGYRARFQRSANGRFGALVVEHSRRGAYEMGEVLRLLWIVPARELTSFALVDGALHPTGRELAELQRALQRFPNLATVTLPPVREVHDRIRVLIEKLASDSYPAADAADELGALCATDARDVLARVMVESTSDSVRLRAGFALSRIGDASVIPALRQAVGRGAERCATFACLLLGMLGAREALDEIAALIDAEPQLAVEALIMLGAPEAIPHLERVLASQDRQPRFAAINALGMLGARSSLPALRAMVAAKDVYDRREAIMALALIGEPSDLALIDAAPRSDEPSARRRAVAHALLGGDTTALARTIDEWQNAPTRDLAVLGAALERVVVSSAEDRDAIARFVATIVNEERAYFANTENGAWGTPLHRFVLAQYERVLARFTPAPPAAP